MTQSAFDFEHPARTLAVSYVRLHEDLFRPDFERWLLENFGIYAAFEREARKVRATGRDHYGANTIIEYLRHQTLLADASSEWKVDDRWTSSIARLFALMNPDCAEFFAYRERKNGVVKAPTRLSRFMAAT